MAGPVLRRRPHASLQEHDTDEDPHGPDVPRPARRYRPQDRVLAGGVRRALLHFCRCGAAITLASPKGGQPPLEPKSDEPGAQTDATHRFAADPAAQTALAHTARLADLRAGDYDALFYPGGHGPLWDLATDKASVALIEATHAAGRPLAAVCHAPAVFSHARAQDGTPLVSRQRVTGFSNTEEAAAGLITVVPFLVEDSLKANGGVFQKGPDWQPFVVVDGTLVTGQNPASSEATARALFAMLAKTSGTRQGQVAA